MIPPEILLFFFSFFFFIKMSSVLECSSSIGLKSSFYIRFHGTFSIVSLNFAGLNHSAVSKILPHVEDQNRWRVYALNTTYPAMTNNFRLLECCQDSNCQVNNALLCLFCFIFSSACWFQQCISNFFRKIVICSTANVNEEVRRWIQLRPIKLQGFQFGIFLISCRKIKKV